MPSCCCGVILSRHDLRLARVCCTGVRYQNNGMNIPVREHPAQHLFCRPKDEMCK